MLKTAARLPPETFKKHVFLSIQGVYTLKKFRLRRAIQKKFGRPAAGQKKPWVPKTMDPAHFPEKTMDPRAHGTHGSMGPNPTLHHSAF